ncbi:efflux RND transporter periplasmic adaptor subunit [Helicobacter sp. MIT 21-1697]|uniref:efflux RND transporter periplasmic adaptor subunit n=1 Tax=Helicobacter sp. MIT 21-1697 TaxID=2993733 RepID=UPI00224AE33C|nr:efflux RND transporter periplasmic adaptor subunit [Helicobacter sp. MIT 21-1697]MCX2717846.1 efflux RND transporter periplasmic adaptor subunit [Helicobacter sp. MIT 21-1697]
MYLYKYCHLIMAFVFVLSFISCSDSDKQGKEMPSLKVETQSIAHQNVALSFEYAARLKSIQSVGVYARVQGVLLSKNFKEGDIVQEGQLLFKIDPARYIAKVNQAKAQWQSAEANFIKANRDWKRVEKLYKQGVYTIDQYDTSRSNFLSAQANVASTQAVLDDVKIDLGYTDVVATISGRIGMRSYDVGNLVGANGQEVLTTITQLSPIYAEFAIPNTDYYLMRGLENARIQVEFVLGNGKVYDKLGKLDFVDSVLDAQTSTIKARSIVDNEEHKLLPNEFVRVRLKGFEAQNAITIPQSALLQDSQGSYVYILKDGKAKIARVILGQNLRNNQVLIASGLSNGDVLVLNQLSKIREGMPLSPITQGELQKSQNKQDKQQEQK